jgi:AcrR family transcriptional regulator
LLEAARGLLGQVGPSALSLREVARVAGVSHAAPAHHFGDKAGLLTALATRGFERFLAAQRAAAERASERNKRLSWTGWAYVMFAAEQPAYFSLMFRPELLRVSDPDFEAASRAAYEFLLECVREAIGELNDEETLRLRATAAWSQAHGLATLWLDGSLKQYTHAPDLDKLARRLFGLPLM